MKSFIHILFAVMLLFSAREVWSQGTAAGSINGRISDPSGAAVAGATVVVTNTGTGVNYQAAASADGFYSVRFLPPGNYTVTASQTGFQKTVQPNVIVETASSPTVNLQLSLGAVSETVTVSESVGLVETQTADRGAGVDNIRMANTPSQGRNIMGLVTAAAGVTVNSAQKSFTPFDNAGSTNLSLSGGISGQNEMLVDGVPNRAGGEAVFGLIPTQETVAEMKVITNAYSAEYGRTTGGVINVTTKSGGNQYHGELYEYNRNTAFAANVFERNLAGQERLPVRFNTFGGTLGGPIKRNKLFFQFGLQRLVSTTPKAFIGHVPTELERAGDFSDSYYNRGGVKTPLTIYDPWSTTFNSATGRFNRTPLAGNRIPSQLMNPVAQAFWKYIPLPNANGDPITRANNYVPAGGAAASAKLSEYSPRVDWNINDTNRLTFRYVRNNYNAYDVEFYPGPADPNIGRPFTRANHNGVVDYTRTLSPTSVLNLRLGMQRYFTANVNSKATEANAANLGFSPTFISQASANFPSFQFGGSTLGSTAFTGAGTESGNQSPTQINNLDANYSKVIGRHQLKVGGQGRLERKYDIRAGYNSGLFNFSSTGSNFDPQLTDPASGDAVASFLMGVGSASIDVNSNPARQSRAVGLFVQDDINVTSKLKVNVGLRWDYNEPLTDRFNAMTGIFDTTSASPLAAQVRNADGASACPACANLVGGLTFPGVNGASRNVYTTTRNNFGPRVGLAYALNSKTAIRTGWGLFYGPLWLDPGQVGFSQTTPSVLYDANYIPQNLINNPFPNGLIPARGSSLGMLTQVGTSVTFVDPNAREPKSQQFSFDVQRELPAGLLVSAGYVFNKVTRIAVNRNLNALTNDQFNLGAAVLNQRVANPFAGLAPGFALNQSTIAYSSLIVPFPQFTSVVSQSSPLGDSRYDAVQFQVTKRYAKGLSFSVAYTISKKLGHYGYQNASDNFLEKTIDPYDFPQVLVPNGSWELPVGKNKWIAGNSPSWLNYVIGGWQVNWLVRLQSGRPLQLAADAIPLDGVDPNAVPGGQTVDQWINRAAFVQNTDPFRLRRWSAISGRLRTPAIRNFDLGLMKNNKITERVNFQLLAQFVNAFNTPQWFDGPSSCTSPGGSCFGQISGFRTQTNLPRQIQLAGRIIF